ncbi:MAG: hypothetical protein Q9166_007776 [cf. Caloplaca sp. 2 TL-2023]
MDPSSPSPPPKPSSPSDLPATLPPLSRPTSDSALSTLRSTTKRKISRKVSSRGRRTRSAASSQAGSLDGSDSSMEEYSIDLANLGDKDSSWTIGKAGERDIERVSSRDEGPEDFTMRLSEWMRGTMPWKGQPELKAKASHSDDEREAEGIEQEAEGKFEEVAERNGESHLQGRSQALYEADDPDDIRPVSTSLPALRTLQESNNRSSAPPFSRMNTEAIQDRAAQEVFDQISALQAEVERLRLENKDHLSSQRSSQHISLQQQKECRILRTQVDDLRSEAKRLQDSEFKSCQKVLRLEQELKRDGSKVGSLRAKFEPVVAELETVRLRAEADKQAADSTINALKADLRSSNNVVAKLQAERSIAASTNGIALETLKAELRAELEACRIQYQHREDILKAQLQAKDTALHPSKQVESEVAATAVLQTELQQTKDQLAESRRVVQNIEDENDLLVQESERQADEIANLKRALEEERLQIHRAANAEVAELQDEISRMQAQKTADTISYSEHTETLSQLANEHASAIEALTAKHKQEIHVLRTAIIKAGEGMKKREERFAATHKKESSNLQKQIKTLREQLRSWKATPPKPTATDDEQNPTILELRSAIHVLNDRLSTANKTRDAAVAEAEKFRLICLRNVEKSKKQIAWLNETMNKEIDKRMEKKMEDREREWRRRIKIMFKEREEMGRQLMEAWGREECGKAKEGEKQKYRYRYFDKEGKFVENGLW